MNRFQQKSWFQYKLFSGLLLIATMLPSIICFLVFSKKLYDWKTVYSESLLLKIEKKKEQKVLKQNLRLFVNQIPETTETFCQRIANIPLLSNEISLLQAATQSATCSPEELSRYQWLTTKNKVLLIPSSFDSDSLFSFHTPVQMNAQDLKTLLKQLDCPGEKPITAPIFIKPIFIKKWKMFKERTPLENETWNVQATIVRREGAHHEK